ncbi:hypothetical protein [Urbifossiella limnaea]|uniref:Uncharacterized protein n=1 Tax=Urbifossiella limnaea TaxID=2528023 RepID=A0A517Y0Q9_9BACT|nr:hypothetical protein [Urbifossiella limnaea]QDU23349.1 hypothetical protein ETAA1_53480 [Urbifossiella limnaea]
MTALRTTRSVPPLLLAAVAMVGCGGPPPEDDAARPTMRELPPPVAEKIDYNPDTRTLKLYSLPPSSRWLVRSSNNPITPEVQAGSTHVLPSDTDPDYTFVSYRRPSGQSSATVKLSDIVAARSTHTSNGP